MSGQKLNFRAKLTVENVTAGDYADTVNLRAEYSSSAEDNSYAQATPNATMQMDISNPDLKGTIQTGDQFYVDFTRIEK